MTPRSIWSRLHRVFQPRQASTCNSSTADSPDLEPAIAQSIVEAIRREARHHVNSQITGIGIRIGELRHLNARRLTDAFAHQLSARHIPEIPLEIEPCPQRNRCPHCDYTFTVVAAEHYCPLCGATDAEPAGGDELELSYLELEERP